MHTRYKQRLQGGNIISNMNGDPFRHKNNKPFTIKHRLKSRFMAEKYIEEIEKGIRFHMVKYAPGVEAFISKANEITFSISPFLLNILDIERGHKPKAILTYDYGRDLSRAKTFLFLTIGEAQAEMFKQYKATISSKDFQEKRNRFFRETNEAKTRIIITDKKTGKEQYRWQIYKTTQTSFRYDFDNPIPKTGIRIPGYNGYWHIVEEIEIENQQLYLIENEFERIEAPRLLINRYKDVLLEDVNEELQKALKQEKVKPLNLIYFDSILDEPEEDIETIDLQHKILKEINYE